MSTIVFKSALAVVVNPLSPAEAATKAPIYSSSTKPASTRFGGLNESSSMSIRFAAMGDGEVRLIDLGCKDALLF